MVDLIAALFLPAYVSSSFAERKHSQTTPVRQATAVFVREATLTSHVLQGASVSLVSWSVVEPGMYLIAACLPALRPICAQWIPKSIRSRFSSHSTRNTIVPLEDLPLAAHLAFANARANDNLVRYHENIGSDGIGSTELETGETDEEKGVLQKYEGAPTKNHGHVSQRNMKV